jgi:hypothetical protein
VGLKKWYMISKTDSWWLMLCAIISCCSSGDGQLKTMERKPVAHLHTIEADSIAVKKIVEDFFVAFDEKDTAALRRILVPETRITHHNGAMTNTQEMIAVINETKNWWPRQRHLSDFEFMSDDGLSVMELSNEVVFHLPENRSVTEPYRETWIFKKSDGNWQPIRVHYSKVTAEKHSEEVTEQ